MLVRRVALLVALTAGLASASAVAIGRPDPQPRDTPIREHGEGLVRFDGHGPEWWARRARRLQVDLAYEQGRGDLLERRLRERIERRLAALWLVQAFMCIHRREGAWDANTGNGYFGGVQMDITFQRTYAPDLLARKGTADNWTPVEQLAVAIVAHASRGFWPWPNTARACGLLS
jgi:hypothetical protein